MPGLSFPSQINIPSCWNISVCIAGIWGKSSTVKWVRKKGVKGWFGQVYMPLIRIIRKKDILKEFPGRTEADLYLWIIEHRYYLMAEYKRGSAWKEQQLILQKKIPPVH